MRFAGIFFWKKGGKKLFFGLIRENEMEKVNSQKRCILGIQSFPLSGICVQTHSGINCICTKAHQLAYVQSINCMCTKAHQLECHNMKHSFRLYAHLVVQTCFIQYCTPVLASRKILSCCALHGGPIHIILQYYIDCVFRESSASSVKYVIADHNYMDVGDCFARAAYKAIPGLAHTIFS